MIDEMLDKDDAYSPIRFSRNYFDEPTKVQPYWISKVFVKNLFGIGRKEGTAEIDFLGKPALTAPNGYGKTLLFKLINAVMEVANGRYPDTLVKLSKTIISTEWDTHTNYHHLFDEVAVETVDGHVYRIVTEDYSTASYVFEKDGEPYAIRDGKFDAIVPPQPSETAGCYLLPTGRLAAPDAYIYDMLCNCGGKVNYNFLNKWYNLMIQGVDVADPTVDPNRVMNRYADIPYDENKTYAASCKDIVAWMSKRQLSHGEAELMMQLMAMISGSKIVLIDAAEIGLHPSTQIDYMRLLSTMYQKGVQVLFTTHSPSMFDLNFSYSNDLFEIFGDDSDE